MSLHYVSCMLADTSVVCLCCLAALLFHSQDATGSLERKSLHASCPVISGTKWAMSKWIRTGRYMTKSELLAMVQNLQRMQVLLSLGKTK
jgi:hypothetical protein